jgi:hypothetical protein
VRSSAKTYSRSLPVDLVLSKRMVMPFGWIFGGQSSSWVEDFDFDFFLLLPLVVLFAAGSASATSFSDLLQQHPMFSMKFLFNL